MNSILCYAFMNKNRVYVRTWNAYHNHAVIAYHVITKLMIFDPN